MPVYHEDTADTDEQRKADMKRFKIECGRFAGTVRARTLGTAWRKLVRRRKRGFAPLARFRELPDDTWHYVKPVWLDAQ